MEFTFAIVTYNSESTIIETMESIKYQIQNYGKDIFFKLVVADDCSKDNTLSILRKWIEINDNLFRDVQILESSENKGVCKNYSRMVKAIKTQFFLQIAGDDIVCSHNIIKNILNLGENELKVFMQYDLVNDKVKLDEFSFARQIYYNNFEHSNKKDIRLLETFPPYRSIEVVFQRGHYSNECLKYMEQYTNFEDDTSLYYILTHNPKTNFSYSYEPFIIYRRSNSALTQSIDNSPQIRFMEDLYKFRSDTFKKEKNLPTKFILFFSLLHAFLMIHRFDTRHTVFKRMVIRNQNKIIKKVSNYNQSLELKKKCESYINNENNYITFLKRNATNFLKDYAVE